MVFQNPDTINGSIEHQENALLRITKSIKRLSIFIRSIRAGTVYLGLRASLKTRELRLIKKELRSA